jgi:hypothetical protein
MSTKNTKNNTNFFKTTGRIYKFYKKSIQQAINVGSFAFGGIDKAFKNQ